MKKVFLYAALGLFVASCASDELVDVTAGGGSASGKSGAITFVTSQENITRATALNKNGNYNFGVFAYKSTDKVNNIMADYLVGYHDDAKAYSEAGTTVGDTPGLVDGKSEWMYEGLGYSEFTGTYAGQRLNEGDAFASNVATQYLRYWDKAAEYTAFYAYAPYVNGGASGSVVKYVDGQEVGTSTDKYVMTIPNGTLKHGYDKPEEFEFMYAWNKVAKANYGHDVALNFKRLNAKVNIKFWEDIPGYNVRIIDLTNDYSVTAVPSIKDGTSNNYGYKLGKIYSENGAKIQFAPVAGTDPTLKQYEGTTVSTPIKFAAPTAAQIGENRINATASATTYYAIPKGSAAGVLANGADKITDAGTLNTDLAETGLTFHVSYELISTTGEVITVKDATVHIPAGEYTNWEANTHYTYIFKITTNSNGSTDSDDTPNPTDPEVPTELGLYPIVFDNCTVEDWDTLESEWNITDGTTLAYHDVQLSTYSVQNGVATDITVTVTNNDTYANATIDYANVAVTGPTGADMTKVVYTSSDHKIAVASDATAGVYTVTYTCNPGTLQYNNHPATWTETFVVGHSYDVMTNLSEVGTNGLADSKLVISTKMDAAAFAEATATTGLSIEYPANAVDSKVAVAMDGSKACVVVANNATPGVYKLVYKVDVEGVPVKVAETTFEVVDYQFALNYATVYNKDGGNTVTATTRTAGTGVTYEYTVSPALTVSGSDITVPNNTTEGDYTVTLTVNKGGDSEVQYTKTFTVQNTYTVALSKNTLNTTVGAANAAEYGSDFIEITSKSNGVDDAKDATTAAKYSVPALAAADYNIFVDSGVVKLQVKKSVAAGTYTVVYTGQTTPDTKTATADFVIQK